MRKVMLVICSILLFSSISYGKEEVGKNLIKNPGFEEGLEGWEIPSWRPNAIKVEIDKDVFQGPGHASVKIVGQEGKEGILIQTYFNPNAKRYKLSGWIKIKGFENNWQAVIQGECGYRDKEGNTHYKYFGGGCTAPQVSDMDWKRFEGEVEVPEGTYYIRVYLLTRHASGKRCEDAPPNRGIAWFDNISLIPISEAEEVPKTSSIEEPKEKVQEIKGIIPIDDFEVEKIIGWSTIAWNGTKSPSLELLKESPFQGEKVMRVSFHSQENCYIERRLDIGDFWDGISFWVRGISDKGSMKIYLRVGSIFFSAGGVNVSKEWQQVVILPSMCSYAWGAKNEEEKIFHPEKITHIAIMPNVPIVFDIDNLSYDIPDKLAIHKAYTERWGSIYDVNEMPKITVELYNTFSQSKKVNIEYILRDYDGKDIFSKREILELSAKSFNKRGITLPKLGVGYYSCEIKLTKPEGDITLNKRILGIAVPVERGKNEGKQFMALNYHGTGNYEWLSKIGVQAVEIMFMMSGIEPEKGKFNLGENSVLEECKKRGITPIGYIPIDPWTIPKWASSAPAGENPSEYMAKPEEFEEYVYQVVKRYGNDIKTWHIACEADARCNNLKRGIDEYLDMVKAVYTGAKRANPEVIVGGCGVCDSDCQRGFPFAKKVWQEVHDYLDGMFFDPYCNGRYFGPGLKVQWPEDYLEDTLKQAIGIVKNYGDNKQLAIEEIGWTVDMSLPVDSIYGKNRAALISRLYIISRAIEEIDRCVWFFLYGAGITERGGDYGLLRLAQEDGGYPNPRPEFCAYATTSKFLLGVNNPQKIDIHQDIPIYLFEKGKGSRIALWSLQKDPVLFQMNLPNSAKCYDIIGRSFTPEKEGNLSILTLTESPIFIVDKTKGVEIYRKVLSEAKYTLPPVKIFNTFSKIDKMEIKIVNQLNKDIEGKIKVEVPEFWKVIELEKDVILSPKEEKTIEIQLQVIKPIPLIPGDFSISFTSPILPKISITTKPQFFKVEKFTPVIDGNLNEYQGLSPIELNKEEYISPPIAVIKGDWTGLNDLSVKAWTTYDEENFYFAAEVTDDKFIQENTGTWIWANDSFQIAFDTLNDGKLSPGSGYKEDDYEFGIALTPVGPQVFQWAGKGAEGGRLVASAKLIVKRQGDKTIYELSLPWSDLSLLKPEKGRVFGFNFTAIDSDKSGGAEYWMGLTEGIAGGKIPSLFHNFFLQ